MIANPVIFAMDLEGVLIPEIWIAVSEKTGIETLRLTTRDIPDYEELMKGRLNILQENKLTLLDIQEVIEKVHPLPGSIEFLNWARSRIQVIILSDTFYEFAQPLMKKLGYPTLFCNSLEVDGNYFIVDYHLRQKDGKRKSVVAFKKLGFSVISIGDSYNDTTMLKEADLGVLFRPPENVEKEFPEFEVFNEYGEVKSFIEECLRVP